MRGCFWEGSAGDEDLLRKSLKSLTPFMSKPTDFAFKESIHESDH